MDNPETQAILGTRLSSSSVLCLLLPVSLGCPFLFLFVFVLGLVLNIACVSGLSILWQYWAQDTGRRQIKQRMDNPETQAILSTGHRTKTNKTKSGQHRDRGNIGHKFFVLFVFVLCLVPNIACVSGLSILCFICLRPVSCA
jgi:hypothetical protein